MERAIVGRAILTFCLVAGALVSVAVDWNDSHLFNPSWTEHARFHDALMLAFLCSVSAIGLWMLWRKRSEPLIAFLIVIAFWLPFFWITPLIAGTSLRASVDEAVPLLWGIPMFPNAIVAGVLCLLSTAAYWLTTLKDPHGE